MAEVYKQPTEGNIVDETSSPRSLDNASPIPQAVGVYDRPALSGAAPSGMLRMLVIFAALLLLGYLFYQWLS